MSSAANVLPSSQCWNLDATLNTSRQYQDAMHYQEIRLSYETGSNGRPQRLTTTQPRQPSGITITKTYTYDSLGRKKSETLKRRSSPTVAATLDLTIRYD